MKSYAFKIKKLAVLFGTLLFIITFGQESTLEDNNEDLPVFEIAEKAHESGYVQFGSGPINHPIGDLDNYLWTSLVTDDIPDDAYVTTVEYYVWIDDNGDESTFWCGDYEIWLDNLSRGGTGKFLKVYDNLGAANGKDGNYDDDTENDSDILLNFRETDAFYGDPVKTIWSFYVEDNLASYSGKLVACYLRIYWENPKPNLTALVAPSGWSAPIVVSSVSGTHTQGPVLYADFITYFDFSFLLQDQEITESFRISYTIDAGVMATYEITDGMSAGEYFTESDFSGRISHGYHDVCIWIDNSGDIEESDETDNRYCLTPYWQYRTPAIPELTNPVDGYTCAETDFTLHWSEANYADYYYVQVDDDNDFTSPIVNEIGVHGTELLVEDLDLSTTYFWRVQGSNSDGQGSWSDTWSFTTVQSAPGTPELYSPADGDGCQPLSITLNWSDIDEAAAYVYHATPDATFTEITYWGGVYTNYVTLSDLKPETTYYWRIIALNECSTLSEWSDPRSFTTGQTGLDKPELMGPVDLSEDLNTSLSFIWNEVAGATSYHLQIADNIEFSPVYLNETGISDSHFGASGLEHNTTYFWRVSASEECASSDWSEIWQFKTIKGEEPTAIIRANQSQYNLGQNYPNPFKRTTRIEFTIPADGEVSIEFIDMQGKVVEQYSGYYNSGLHRVEVSGNFDPGLYFYRMIAKDFTDTKLSIVF